ncbi:acetyl-CoA synthetase-like protein [Lentinus tigrinus ALCF2SS1-7]|uniref:acetyl-CoA synthetase-like protein n=1 Tax=Lentinus tigrinus ALCF2SS1-7 TaxID=1328758 RepID=UPI001165CA20|nr:acetyl-CoA synthetase-like protein [Lentinus tigrinus ALCF2SS1-7]
MSLTRFNSPRQIIQAGGITLPELYEWHAKENPNFDLFRYYDGQRIRSITYSEVVERARGVAQHILSITGTGSAHHAEIIAIAANIDAITYFLTILGILLAGHTAFPVSLRNSPAAIADMLQKTHCRHVLVLRDDSTRSLVEEAIRSYASADAHPLLAFDEMLSASTIRDPQDVRKKYDLLGPAIILHSSGSTNHPKTITWTHKSLLSWGTVPWYGEVDTTGATVGCHSVPMTHAFGVSMCGHAAAVGWVIAVPPPTSPPIPPTPENVFEGSVATEVEYLMTVPMFVEQWASDPRKVDCMMRMKGIVFGGAPMKQEIGDSLTSKGVTLYTTYGATEVGSIANAFPANPGMNWPYFSITPWIQTVQKDMGDGTYELIVLSSPDHPLAVVNTKVGDVDAYATNDLLEPHPNKPGLWKVYGRKDDQIILSNGEKTNPLPLEHIINNDSLVRSSVVFGNGKFQNGVLIDPQVGSHVDPHDRNSIEAYRNQIWPSIERANEFAPQHSRIFKEMILVASPEKPFAYNMKGYPRRIAIQTLYSQEIEALYAEVESSAQGDIPAPSVWTLDTTRGFVRVVVERVLRRQLSDDGNIFQHGCDSLQVTWIRNTIFRALRQSSPRVVQTFPMDVVFQAPTIDELARVIMHALQGSHDTDTAGSKTSSADLVRLAHQYVSSIPKRSHGLLRRDASKMVVLVTGTTGGFGSDVLEHLLLDDGVATVYAFNRKDSSALERQTARFRERGLQVSLLTSSKLRMIEADLSTPGFGIPPEILDEIRRSITHILHNAWRVDFKLTLASFEADLLGLRNLIELAVQSPYGEAPKLQFVSSIGILSDCKLSSPIPEVPIDPTSAVGTGYSESKWVGERILLELAEKDGLPVTIVRLGQVCGCKNGYWNEKEWFPALVKSITGCLPDMEMDVAFVPSYPAACAMVDMLRSSQRILHLVHPRPVSMRKLVVPIAEELNVNIVPYPEWLSKLEKYSSAGGANELDMLRQHPALRLLDFFRAMKPMVEVSTEEAIRASEVLVRVPELGAEDSRQWVAAWRASGFL